MHCGYGLCGITSNSVAYYSTLLQRSHRGRPGRPSVTAACGAKRPTVKELAHEVTSEAGSKEIIGSA